MMRPAFVFAVLTVWLATASAGVPFTATTQKIEYASGNETVSGLLFTRATRKPQKTTRQPALIVVHEFWGQNDWVKERSQMLAMAGYVTLSVDLYRGQVTADPSVAHELMRGVPHDRALRDLRAAIDTLAKRPDVDPARIGVIGWCMGGGYAVELSAADPRIQATVVYYGALPTDVKTIKAPLLGNFGADDKGISAKSVLAFESALKAQGTPADIKIYPGAGHAFASNNPASYRAEAAHDADERTKVFLEKTLHP